MLERGVSPPEACRSGAGWRTGCVFRDCPDCPEMVVIPAGAFMMGSPDGELGQSAFTQGRIAAHEQVDDSAGNELHTPCEIVAGDGWQGLG